MSVHRSAAVGFNRAAAEYDRARPSYPGAVVNVLRDAGLVHAARIVDVGAGTGKLTRVLAAAWPEVVAVEPVEGMRAVLRAVLPGVEVIDGAAARLPFDPATFDAVVVGQAIHWIADGEALSEFARVLRPDGVLVIVQNVRDRTQRLHAFISEHREARAEGAPSFASGAWREAIDTHGGFALDDAVLLENSLELSHDLVRDQFCSLAPIAALDETARHAELAALDGVLRDEPDPVILRYATHVYLARLRDRREDLFDCGIR